MEPDYQALGRYTHLCEQVAKAARMLAVLDGDLTPQQAADAAELADANGTA